MGRPQKPTPLKFCRFCGAQMERKRQPHGGIETLSSFNRKVFCSLPCFGAAQAKVPSTLEEAYTRARQLCRRVSCNRCGSLERLQVHHQDRNPFNNQANNLEVLCVPCHVKEHLKPTRMSTCAICGVSFLARSHRNRPKICSALCAKEYGRINARKRWYPELQNSAATAMPSTRKPPKSSSKAT